MSVIRVNGYLVLDRSLTDEQGHYMFRFHKIPHYRRDNWELWNIPDPCRNAVDLPLGVDCEFYTGPMGLGLLPCLRPPKWQPSRYCGWHPSYHKRWIIWGGEYQGSHYDKPAEWLRYILRMMLTPWGHSVNGYLEWYDDPYQNVGAVQVENNLVYVLKPKEITRPTWTAI